MAMSSECTSCGKPIDTEAGESVTECPHCGAALNQPDAVNAAVPDSAVHSAGDDAVPVFPGFPIGEDESSIDEFPSFSPEDAPLGEYVAVPSVAAEEHEQPAESADAPTETQSTPAAAPGESVQRRGVPYALFLLLAGYASAVTLALIYLWFVGGPKHQLESLPDIEPKKDAYLVPEDAELPRGHTLRLGQTRRFGNLEVTPLRVSRGQTVLLDVNRKTETSTIDETLKLWLRFRNVSQDQSIAPFSRRLLFSRMWEEPRANTFVCRVGEKSKEGFRVLTFPLNVERTGIVFKDQQIDRKIKPQETFETYIPSDDDGLDKLTGDLVWRVHFRKGYNPETHNGVTTLIEVRFHSDEIEGESAEGSS